MMDPIIFYTSDPNKRGRDEEYEDEFEDLPEDDHEIEDMKYFTESDSRFLKHFL